MARRFVQRHQAEVCVPCWLKAGGGVFSAFCIALLLGDTTGASMIVAPMGASAVLIYCVPESPLSQPAHVIGGHAVAAAAALLADHFLPGGPWTLAGSLAAIIVLLGLLRLTHPPAGATALAVMLTHPSWTFLLTPVLSGAATLVLVAVLVHRLPPAIPYPLPARAAAAKDTG
ncbi:MAG: HPP family protein [Rhodomicrobium sp.]